VPRLEVRLGAERGSRRRGGAIRRLGRLTAAKPRAHPEGWSPHRLTTYTNMCTIAGRVGGSGGRDRGPGAGRRRRRAGRGPPAAGPAGRQAGRGGGGVRRRRAVGRRRRHLDGRLAGRPGRHGAPRGHPGHPPGPARPPPAGHRRGVARGAPVDRAGRPQLPAADVAAALGAWRAGAVDAAPPDPPPQTLQASRLLAGRLPVDGSLDAETGELLLTALRVARAGEADDEPPRGTATRRADAL